MKTPTHLDLAHGLMLFSLLAFIGAVFLAYGGISDEYLIVQGLAHVAMIVLAVVFKFAYILRLHNLYKLGRAVN